MIQVLPLDVSDRHVFFIQLRGFFPRTVLEPSSLYRPGFSDIEVAKAGTVDRIEPAKKAAKIRRMTGAPIWEASVAAAQTIFCLALCW